MGPVSGLYIKVIAPYKEGEQEFVPGQELFITGGENGTAIYFPREEHAIISYEGQDVHYAVAIPAGEGRYVLDRIGGGVSVVAGEKMFLPNPISQVVVRRILSKEQVDLWYPGNNEAHAYNNRLREIQQQDGVDYVTKDATERSALMGMDTMSFSARSSQAASPAFADKVSRKTKHTPPRTITIDSKFDGVPVISPWTGYAVQINDKAGNSRVVVGPATELLGYDETLEIMSLSTGTPKSDDRTLKTVYLRIFGNKVSDQVDVETKDMVDVTLHLSYRIHFTGDKAKWFALENYVKFVCDHIGSVLRGVVKSKTIEEFYTNSISIIRDAILGIPADDGQGNMKRPGMKFEENNMMVYDVEVLQVGIDDSSIEDDLVQAMHSAVRRTIVLNEARGELAATTERESISRQILAAQNATMLEKTKLASKLVEAELETTLAKIQSQLAAVQKESAIREAREADSDRAHKAMLLRNQAEIDQRQAEAKDTQQLRIEFVQAEAKALVEKLSSIKGEIATAMIELGNKDLMAKMAEASAPMKLLGGPDLLTVFKEVFQGSPLEAIFTGLIAPKVIERAIPSRNQVAAQ